MAVSYSLTRDSSSIGNKYEVRTKIIPDTSYPLNGYLIDPAKLGLIEIDSLIVPNLFAGYGYSFDVSTKKLKIGTVSSKATFFSAVAPAGLFIDYGNLIGGPFVVGETITGGTSGATGVIAEVDTARLRIRYTPGVGRFNYGETITGGTSAATAQVFYLPYRIYSFGTDDIVPLTAYDDDITGRPFSLTNKYTPWVTATAGTIVGTFVDGEAFTIAPGGCTGSIETVQGEGSVLDLSITAGSPALTGTITGGTSGATAVINSWQWAKVFHKYGSPNPNEVRVVSAIAPDSLYFLALNGKLNEFMVGTNVFSVLPEIEIIACGR